MFILSSLVRLYLETAAQSCVAVQETTLWNVLITPVTPLKSVERLMVLQAVILKVIMFVEILKNLDWNDPLHLKKVSFKEWMV